MTFLSLCLVRIVYWYASPVAPVDVNNLGYTKAEQDVPLDGDIEVYKENVSKKISLSGYTKGPFLLHFWAPWCTACVKEMPSLSRFKQFKVVCVVLGNTHKEDIEKFYKEQSITRFKVIKDPTGALAKTLQIESLPTTLLIDEFKHEKGRFVGAINWDQKGLLRGIQNELTK